MTRKRYEELLHAEHPFQLNANQSNWIRQVAMGAFGINEDIPFVTKLDNAKCIKASKKGPRNEILEALITPKEMLLMDMLLHMLAQDKSPLLATMEDLPKKCADFLKAYHPDSIREAESAARRNKKPGPSTAPESNSAI